MTDKQKSDIVKRHNVLRALEGAAGMEMITWNEPLMTIFHYISDLLPYDVAESLADSLPHGYAADMEMMTWNESLAAAAKDWVAQCRWRHGYPPLPGTHFTSYGQNLYMIGGAPIDVVDAVESWYDEKLDYDYDTMTCTPGKTCGNYLQVAWAQTRQVGCAYHYCGRMEESSVTNAEFLVCNYLPPGNFHGQKPFKKGRSPCSKCESGAGWCTDRLCNSDCSTEGGDCSCFATCYMPNRMNENTCQCSCVDGWYGPDCSELCEDKNEQCDPSPGNSGWPPDWCNHPQYGSLVKRDCPVMCKLCKPDPDAYCQCRYNWPDDWCSRPKYGSMIKRDCPDAYDCSPHQQQCCIVTLLSYIILSLTITRITLL